MTPSKLIKRLRVDDPRPCPPRCVLEIDVTAVVGK